MIRWEREILPGPLTITTKLAARRIKSNSYPESPVRLVAPFTRNIAPNITMDNSAPEIRVRTPINRKIPGTNSANAIGICISAGMPILEIQPPNPGFPNFPNP